MSAPTAAPQTESEEEAFYRRAIEEEIETSAMGMPGALTRGGGAADGADEAEQREEHEEIVRTFMSQ